MAHQVRVPINSDEDIVTARRTGRVLASEAGFPSSDLTLIATAISELARNIVLYAEYGEVVIRLEEVSGRTGIVVVARDEGPGIPDVEHAMQDGYSTSGGLGLGLPGTKRLMDEFEIESEVGRGTVVTVKKWR